MTCSQPCCRRPVRDRLDYKEVLKVGRAHTLPRMPGAETRRHSSRGSYFSYVDTVRNALMAVLAWAATILVSVTLITPASGDSSISFVEGPPSTLNSTNMNTEGPICWEAHAIHESDCFHAEPLTAETYPLTQEMLERASRRYTTTNLSLHRAFQRARKRGVLKVMVVGGSVTYGHDCVSPAGLTCVQCAWPNRLQQWFDERVEDFKVEVRGQDN